MALSSPACLRGGAGPERFPCPCCGHLVFGAAPGSHEICPVCFWEDDAAQLREPTTLGANAVTLAEAQRNFAELGACEARVASFVRPPAADEPRDPLWRPVHPARGTLPEHGYYRRTPSSTRASRRNGGGTRAAGSRAIYCVEDNVTCLPVRASDRTSASPAGERERDADR